MSISLPYAGQLTHIAPSCLVPFRPELPEELGALQARLVDVALEVEHACRDGDGGRCAGSLRALDDTLHQYLIDEGMQFEPYMRYALEQDLETLQLMRRLRTRLRELAREVHDIAELGAHACPGARTMRLVEEVMARVRGELAQCLDLQRTLLFPRYQPLRAYALG